MTSSRTEVGTRAPGSALFESLNSAAGLGPLVAVFTILLSCEPSSHPPRDSGITGDIAFVDVTVLTMGESDGALTGQTVLVSGDTILAIGATVDVQVPTDATVVDGVGRFLMPGLTDMHVHLEYSEDPGILNLFLANGVTTVRNMDGRPYILEWRDLIERGEMLGPRIHTAGPILDGDPPLRDDNLAIGSADEARDAVRAQATAGYDFVKVYTNLSPDAFAAIVDEAAAQGMAVAGHVPGDLSVEDALASGMWSIEHVTELGDLVEASDSPFRNGWHWSKLYLAMPVDTTRYADAAAQVVRAGVGIVATTVQADRALAPRDTIDAWLLGPEMAYLGSEVLDFWEWLATRSLDRMDAADWALVDAGRENRIRLVRALHDAGAVLLIGTDTPNPFVVPGVSLHEELANHEAAGIERTRILEMATREAARFLGALEEVGTVEAGKRADLLLLDADPRESLATLRRPVGVMTAGRWLSAEAIAEVLAEIAADGGLN
ncbi:MAG: amidohydrolase family protein [Gemmatimonadota bacterium]|nr:amidohydrolase family protein [Gemmatimonadota bacterium]